MSCSPLQDTLLHQALTLQSLDDVAMRDLLACALDRNRVGCGVFLRSRSLSGVRQDKYPQSGAGGHALTILLSTVEDSTG